MEPIKDKTGVYYTKSDVNLMTLRVTLRELSTTQILKTKLSEERSSGIRMERLTSGGLQQHQEFHEEKLIKWQEKILSEIDAIKYERNKYRHGKYEKYHKLAVNRKKKKQKRIFTYIDDDNVTTEKPATISSTEKIEDLRNRMNAITISETSEKEEEGKEEQKKTIYFYLMADVAPKDSLGDSREDHRILGKIKYDTLGRLTFDPDLNKKGQKPYRIEGLIKGNSIYEYTFEIVSSIDVTTSEKTSKQAPVPRMLTIDASDFDKPSDGNTRFVYSGEILRCLYFSEDCGVIYIYYQLDLPEDWRMEGNCEKSGMSEACYPLIGPEGPVYHFSYPLNFAVLRKPNAKGWPCLLLSVFSRGWLTNDCDQGFAAFTLPHPGYSDQSVYEVNLWRPSQTTISSKLTRHFIGGIHLYRNSSHLNPSNNQGKKIMVSRLGLRTEGSGTIELRIYSVLQTNLDISSAESLSMLENYMHCHPATLAVIKAFQKSFTRLKAAKQK